MQKFPVPAGFQEILADFTQEVLRDQPANIIEYAAQYFEMLEKGKKMQFSGSTRKNEPMARYWKPYSDIWMI